MACWKVRTEEALLLLSAISVLKEVVTAEAAAVKHRLRKGLRAVVVRVVVVKRKERWGLWGLRREEIIMGRERIAIGR